MGKPYDHQFFFKGSGCSHGEMVCSGCRQPIFNHAHDWMSYKKSKSYDWAFHCFHRKCWQGRDGWSEIEAKNAKVKSRNDTIMADLKLVAEKHKIGDAHVLAEFAAAALGGDLEEFYSY